MLQVLTDPAVGGWPADRVSVFQDPNDIRDLLPQLRRIAQNTSDLLLLYLVGHGTILPQGELAFALSDTHADNPDITGLEYSRVRNALRHSPARVKVAILDCCYSGRAIEALSSSDGIADLVDVSGTYTLTASDFVAHVPPPDLQANARTSFTGEFIDLLRAGLPGGPAQLQLDQLYPHLKHRLVASGLPAPNQRGTDTASQLPFCRNAAYVADTAEGGSLVTPLRSGLTIESTESTHDESTPKIPVGQACPRCGAWIVEPLLHQAWHRDSDR